MKAFGFHLQPLAATAAAALVLALLGTEPGRHTLAWICLQSAEALTHATHIHVFPLDRLDPTCPQCM
jgi:hypothetical protein